MPWQPRGYIGTLQGQAIPGAAYSSLTRDLTCMLHSGMGLQAPPWTKWTCRLRYVRFSFALSHPTPRPALCPWPTSSATAPPPWNAAFGVSPFYRYLSDQPWQPWWRQQSSGQAPNPQSIILVLAMAGSHLTRHPLPRSLCTRRCLAGWRGGNLSTCGHVGASKNSHDPQGH